MSNEENVITMGSGNARDPKLEKISQALNNPDIPASEFSKLIDTEFQAITDIVELPSKGIFYANKQSTIKVKHLTTDEDNILTSPELIRNGKVLDVLLENSIVDNTLSAEDMLVGDRNAVLLFLRKEGFGDVYPVKMLCPNCGESFKEDVLISKLETKELKETPDSNGYFGVQLPKTKWNIKFRLLTGKDEGFLTKKAETPKKTRQNVSYSQLLTERYVLQIMEINGISDKLQIKKAVTNMPISDSLFLREYMREIEPGVDMSYDFTCKHCQHEFEDTVPVTATLFWPNAKI